MVFRSKISSALAVGFAAVLLTVPVAGQQQEEKKDEQSRERRDATTLTGCLTKGDTAGQYMLSDTTSGEKKRVTASSGVDLEKHSANHTVRLTGKLSDDGQTFTATNVEHVSETCAKTP